MPETFSIEPPVLKIRPHDLEYFLRLITYYIIFILGFFVLSFVFYNIFISISSSRIPFNLKLLFYVANIIFMAFLIFKNRFFFNFNALVSITFDDEKEILTLGVLNRSNARAKTENVLYKDITVFYSEFFDLEKGISKKMKIKKGFFTLVDWKISYSAWEKMECLNDIVDKLKIIAFDNHHYYVENETWQRVKN